MNVNNNIIKLRIKKTFEEYPVASDESQPNRSFRYKSPIRKLSNKASFLNIPKSGEKVSNKSSKFKNSSNALSNKSKDALHASQISEEQEEKLKIIKPKKSTDSKDKLSTIKKLSQESETKPKRIHPSDEAELKDDSVRSVSDSEEEKRDHNFLSPYDALNNESYHNNRYSNEVKEDDNNIVQNLEAKLKSLDYHTFKDESKEDINEKAQQAVQLNSPVKSRQSETLNNPRTIKVVKSARKRSKPPTKKDGMKLIKSLQKLEITGWEDKEELQVFYDKMMKTTKNKKKMLMGKEFKKSKKKVKILYN